MLLVWCGVRWFQTLLDQQLSLKHTVKCSYLCFDWVASTEVLVFNFTTFTSEWVNHSFVSADMNSLECFAAESFALLGLDCLISKTWLEHLFPSIVPGSDWQISIHNLNTSFIYKDWLILIRFLLCLEKKDHTWYCNLNSASIKITNPKPCQQKKYWEPISAFRLQCKQGFSSPNNVNCLNRCWSINATHVKSGGWD